MDKDEQYMHLALKEAKKAEEINEVPIGAIIVNQNGIIASGYNERESTKLAVSHAEMIAITKANKQLNSWRLEDCTLYVTLEPCPMCAGAIVQSRIKRVVFGASDQKAGCAGTILNLLEESKFNHQVNVTSGILADECQRIISNFFHTIRVKKKQSY